MSDIRKLPGVEPLPENPLGIAPRRDGTYCTHESVMLDEHERTVHCSKCDATIEPFSFLLHNAKTLQMAWQSHAMVQRRVSELNERLHELKKQEQRLRAQVCLLYTSPSPRD